MGLKQPEGAHINSLSFNGRIDSLGKFVKLPGQTHESIAESCRDANLVSEAPSDDERKPTMLLSDSAFISRKPAPSANTTGSGAKVNATTRTLTNSGVYVNNVEIQKDVHPLQGCSIQDGVSPLQASCPTRSRFGQPLSAAPMLPGKSFLEPRLSPLCYTTLESKSKRPFTTSMNQEYQRKRQRLDQRTESTSPSSFVEARQDEEDAALARRKAARSAQVKEASVIIEAAVALASLQSARTS